MQRYFTEKCLEKLEFNNKSELYYHLTKVLRSKVSQNVELCDADGSCYIYEIVNIDKASITFERQSEVTEQTELENELVLIVSLLKNNNFELVLQKAVELGVTKIVPLETSRTIVKSSNYKDKKFDRFNKIVLEACEQSKRRRIPVLTPVCSISDLSDIDIENKYVAYEKSTKVDSLYNKVVSSSGGYGIVIGPEGGFSEVEIDELESIGFTCVNLGGRILRAETAAICACSIISMVIDSK